MEMWAGLLVVNVCFLCVCVCFFSFFLFLEKFGRLVHGVCDDWVHHVTNNGE